MNGKSVIHVIAELEYGQCLLSDKKITHSNLTRNYKIVFHVFVQQPQLSRIVYFVLMSELPRELALVV